MDNMMRQGRQLLRRAGRFTARHKYHGVALVVILLWCLPYFTSGERIEWGDFSFFAQGYEAVRLSILEYRQFPWFNPWMAGGVPLYANPQIGVFSPQTLLVMLFGASAGLKFALVLFTVAGYVSMYILLARFFKVKQVVAIPLSLIWIFSSFFVAHLPSHFTFVWYMLAPLYVHLALTVKDWKGGAWLGLAFAVMALSALHNPFFHIGFVVAMIILLRLLFFVRWRWRLWWAIVAATGVFIALAGHRLLLTVQNVRDFPRELTDPAASTAVSFLGLILPFSRTHGFFLVNTPQWYEAPFSFSEVTSSIGIIASLAAVVCGLWIFFSLWKLPTLKQQNRAIRDTWLLPLTVAFVALSFFAIGLGATHSIAPYNLLQILPVLNEMRVASRWFLGVSFCLIVFIGLVYMRLPKRSRLKSILPFLLIAGALELFILNAGYQHGYFLHEVSKPAVPTSSLVFRQTHDFGDIRTLPDGTSINDSRDSDFFREYEATLFNTGSLYANDALLYRLPLHKTAFCWQQDCGLVLSGNAEVLSWSPQRIVLRRTSAGPIQLNMSNSNYFVINGTRSDSTKAAEPFQPFIIRDSRDRIVIDVRPAIIE